MGVKDVRMTFFSFDLSYRPPFDWQSLIDYYRLRAVTGIEVVEDETYTRSFSVHGDKGWFCIRHKPEHDCVGLEVNASGPSCLDAVVQRVERMLDLDADPKTLDLFFGKDDLLGDTWSRNPGLRVPVCWDPFEFVVRAIAGQLISVHAATKGVGKVVDKVGETLPFPAPKGIVSLFPTPMRLGRTDIRSCGLTRTKAGAVKAIARALEEGSICLKKKDTLESFLQQCTAIKGVGDWTAQTIAMRGLGYKDAFPAADLAIVKAIGHKTQPMKPAAIRTLAERWRPWRSYAAMLLWKMDTE